MSGAIPCILIGPWDEWRPDWYWRLEPAKLSARHGPLGEIRETLKALCFSMAVSLKPMLAYQLQVQATQTGVKYDWTGTFRGSRRW